MALIDIFKKKKKEKKLKEKKIEKAGPEKKIEKQKPVEAPTSRVKEKKNDQTYRILKTPQVTERATDLAKKNQYVFKVWPRANKLEIKKAVENLYAVDALSVKIIRVPAKRRRLGRIKGWRKGYKKAIVRIKEGQKIEVLPR